MQYDKIDKAYWYIIFFNDKMKKKILIFFTACVLSFVLFSGNDELKLRVVPMSATHWQSVQNQVNTNGWCHIKEQNVLLVITNGCPTIEYLLPVFFCPNWVIDDLERTPFNISGMYRNKKSSITEPKSY